MRDLAAFMIHAIETGTTGTDNIVGDDTVTMAKFQEAMGQVIATPPHTLTWISDMAFLRQCKLGANVPWIPPMLTATGQKYGQSRQTPSVKVARTRMPSIFEWRGNNQRGGAMLRRSISFVALLFAIVSTVGSEVFAQPASNNPGVILEGTAGRMAYKDDSGGVDRREFTVRAGYRMCPYCSGFGQRIRLMPYLSLGISDLAGLSHRSTNSAAISALDFGLAGVISAGNVVRLELAAATGFKRTAERLTTVGTGRDFINLSGAGGRRVAFQIHRVCLPLPLIGRRTLVAGVSSTKGRYDTVELAGDTRSLPQPTNYKSTAFSIGIQSRTLLSDCAGL